MPRLPRALVQLAPPDGRAGGCRIQGGGAQDPTITLAGAEALNHMQKKVRNLRGLELLDNAGHFIQQEQPQRLNAFLLDFLAGL